MLKTPRCGPVEKVRDILTYNFLLHDTKQLVTHSNVHPAKDPLFPNLHECPNPSHGDTTIPAVKPMTQSIVDYYDQPIHIPVFSPEELLGMTLLHDTPEGQTVCTKVICQILDYEAADHQKINFLLSMDVGELEEIVSYNELSDLIT